MSMNTLMIDEHFHYHSDESSSFLEHPHEVKEFEPQTENGKASDDVEVLALSVVH